MWVLSCQAGLLPSASACGIGPTLDSTREQKAFVLLQTWIYPGTGVSGRGIN